MPDYDHCVMCGFPVFIGHDFCSLCLEDLEQNDIDEIEYNPWWASAEEESSDDVPS